MSLQLPILGQEPETPVSGPPKKRRRPALACLQCRRRKVRCDQNKPCNNCTKSRIPDCTFPQTHTPGLQVNELVTPRHQTPSLAPRRVPAPTTNHSLQSHGLSPRDIRPQHEARHTSSTQKARSMSSATGSPAVNTSSSSPQARIDGPNVDALLAKITELEKTVSKLSSSNDTRPEDVTASQKSASPARDGSSGHRFGNQSNWMNNTSLYSKVLRVLSESQTEESQLRQTSANCKALGKRIEKLLSVNTAPVAIGTRIPERALADQLLEGYFSNFEGLFRVIHLPTFRAAYERYWQQRDSAADVFLLQLQVCMSLGVTAHQDSLRWRNAASQWLLEAQTWLHGSSGKAKKKPTFEELQLACLVLIAEANTSGTDHLSQCWVDAGNLVRKAICAGLHRDPKYLGNITIQQAEMRRRLWVTILELNLLLSLQSGRPPLISPSDYDTCPPASLNDEDLDKDLGSTSSPGVDREKPTETAIQLAYFDSFNLRLEIVCKLSDFGKDMSYDQLLRLHSELSKSQRAMRQRFALFSSVQTGDASPRYTSSQTSLSEILLSRYFLALHMPVLGSSIKNPAFHFSRRFCLATSIQVVEASGILSNTRHNDGANNRTLGSTLASLFVNSPGIFRHIASQAVFAIALELITFREEECDNHGAFPVEDATELLQYLKSAQEWAAERIRAGLTDVRSYCFIAACISYAASLEAGGEALDVEREIVDAAVRGHERCLELLNGIAEALGAFTNESDNSSRVNTPAGSLAVTDMSFDWVGNFMEENLDGFAFDWTYPIDTGTESMNLGLMAL